MKLSGTAALYTQKKELEAALAITNRQIAMAEEFSGESKPEKKTRRKRTAKVNGSGAPIEQPVNYGAGFGKEV